jgi:hypothetical protein
MAIRMYKGKLFDEIDRIDGPNGRLVVGFVLDSHTGKRTGGRVKVPESEVTLTGDDQTCLDISQMSEGALLDFVLGNTEYLHDPYYAVFARAISARHAELRAAQK